MIDKSLFKIGERIIISEKFFHISDITNTSIKLLRKGFTYVVPFDKLNEKEIQFVNDDSPNDNLID